MMPDDQELMKRLKKGDEEALRLLVNRHRQSILNLAYRYVGNQDDAEEVAQDVFVNLYRSASRYTPQGKLTTYMYRIAVNLSLNKIRDRKVGRYLSLHGLSERNTAGNPADETQRPDTILENKELEAVVRAALDTLPAGQRTAVILKRFNGLSYEEIAEVMECSVSAVESRLHRAKLALQKKLKAYAKNE
ncbi:MAG TPA: sigma-70 family RNA polymerase sigma factor [bacterium]|nr:sigma-70 family RNA polymerase sigma factor [bacterium]